MHTPARCVTRGHAHVVVWLIENGGKLQLVDKTGGTALHFAAANGKLEVVRRLLENGIDRDVMDTDDLTAGMLATVCQQDHCAALINNWTSESRDFVDSVRLTIPDIVHSDVIDGSRDPTDVTEWPPPPPPLVVNNTAAAAAAGGDNSCSDSGEYELHSAETNTEVGPSVRDKEQSDATESRDVEENAPKQSPSVPPPPPPPDDRRLPPRNPVHRCPDVSLHLPPPDPPALPPLRPIGQNLVRRTTSTTGLERGLPNWKAEQLRASKSVSDLIAELKSQGGVAALRKVNLRSPGNSVKFLAVQQTTPDELASTDGFGVKLRHVTSLTNHN